MGAHANSSTSLLCAMMILNRMTQIAFTVLMCRKAASQSINRMMNMAHWGIARVAKKSHTVLSFRCSARLQDVYQLYKYDRRTVAHVNGGTGKYKKWPFSNMTSHGRSLYSLKPKFAKLITSSSPCYEFSLIEVSREAVSAPDSISLNS